MQISLTSKEIKFIIAISIQVLILCSIIIFKGITLRSGTEVILRIEPIDPRDPLRGDHLHFSYEISRLSSAFFAYSPVKEGDIVYVPLERSGKVWTAVHGVQKTKPGEEKVFIKGQITNIQSDRFYGVDYYYLTYGIEDYFIQEGMGSDINFLRKEVVAKVKIDKNGNAVLEKIYIDGKPWP